MVKEHSVHYRHSPSGIKLKGTSSHTFIEPLIYLFLIFVEFSVNPVYPTMGGENCQIYVVLITRKCI